MTNNKMVAEWKYAYKEYYGRRGFYFRNDKGISLPEEYKNHKSLFNWQQNFKIMKQKPTEEES
jgi:hypothetical protein